MPNQQYGELESDSAKKIFLIEFTKELIINSAKEKIPKLRERVFGGERIKEMPIRVQIPQRKPPLIPRQIEKEESEKAENVFPEFPDYVPKPSQEQIGIAPNARIPRRTAPYVLRIPETRLPETFKYLKPAPGRVEVDIIRLNPLLKDPYVKTIECNGPDEPIIVSGLMGRKPTGISLNKEEIDDVIKKFSEVSKIPVTTGIYRVVVGKVLFLAIISEVINSKFIIKKL
jgi:hypothetical protein